jgi:hypothetical protein
MVLLHIFPFSQERAQFAGSKPDGGHLVVSVALAGDGIGY